MCFLWDINYQLFLLVTETTKELITLMNIQLVFSVNVALEKQAHF